MVGEESLQELGVEMMKIMMTTRDCCTVLHQDQEE